MNLFLLNISHLFLDIYGSFLLPILPMLTAKFSMSVFAISAIMSVAYLMSSTLQPVWGKLADRINSPSFILAGFLLTCVSISFAGVAPTVFLLAVCIILTNLGEGLYHPQATAFINNLSKKSRVNRNLGLYLSLGAIGFAAGPVVSGYIAQNFGLEYFIFMLIPAAIIATVLFVFFKPKRAPVVHSSTTMVDVLKLPKLRWLILLGFMRPLILCAYCIYMPFLWKQMGYSVIQTGVFIGLFSVLGAISLYVGGILSRKTRSLYMFAVPLILTSICGILSLQFYSIHELIPGVVFFLLTSFFVNLTAGINISLAQAQAPEYKATIAGIINGFSWGVIGLTLAPIGFVIDKMGIINVLTVISIIPATLGLALISPMKISAKNR